MPGCSSCSDEFTCLTCDNSFLYPLTDGTGRGCWCQPTENMTFDGNGSCQCVRGYYLTERGCKKCEDLIPDCQECVVTPVDSGIELYTGANISGETQNRMFLECNSCT